MERLMASIDSLPLFPLGLVLYPDEQLPLHIFEERYKDLTHYCLDHEVAFGIVLAEDGRIADVGTTARIERVVTEYDDGRMDIVVEGEERFRIVEVHDDKSYYTADVDLLREAEGDLDLDLKERVITQHMKLLELAGRTVRPDLYDDVAHLSFVLAQNAGLDPSQKQEVLRLSTESERIEYLIDHFESLIPRVEQTEDLRRRIRSNGHFKDFPPEEV
jgi:ATP-dependent Lon protease